MMKIKTTATRRVLALFMSVLMLMTAWVFVAPTASAANEITVVPTADGAYVYFNASGTVNKIQAPTWTEYNGQDVCPWINMTSGSWTVNGQSYNYRVEIKRSDFKNEGGLYHTHIYQNDTYKAAIDYYLKSPKVQNTEYYYASGTNFIYQLILYYSSSSNSDAENWLRNNGWTPWGHNFNAGDNSSSKYVHSGYKTTTDPTVAIKRVLVADGHPTSLDYNGATYYAVGSGGSAQTPTGGDGMVDLNKGNGGADLYLMATAVFNAGPAITALDMGQAGNS